MYKKSALFFNPYLTSEVDGVGGVLKSYPEDFIVEEIPSYTPSGSGEHCYLAIEKRGITTLEAIRRVAAGLKIQERNVGYAGMKDAAGITRQTISVQGVKPEKALSLKLDSVSILSAELHSNKLKLGHLKGNRFNIAIRGVSESAVQSVPKVLETLEKRGVPNFFGYQRYGLRGDSHLLGMAMLQRNWQLATDLLIGEEAEITDEEWAAAILLYRKGDLAGALHQFPPYCRSERDVLKRLIAKPEEYEKAFSSIHPRLKKLYLSATQSFLFDKAVAMRIQNLDVLLDGDLAVKHINGSCFMVGSAETEQGRADDFEISASGPMFGCKMKCPEGDVWGVESEILRSSGLELSMFDMPGGLRMEGERRVLRVPVTELTYDLEDDRLNLRFVLPRGSYATSLVREITKEF
ncbi:MAG: tRNA pseudouridine(13) synthase TruD [Desulfuromonadaceae bacterium]|nr:tRNA pseudouridine(13) synthase TruD [Desulfuromonadaceae bacterium]MDD2856292.1 tRNA pseudouridine(13) synthase TruD [Desulfuromonadaceae bacterium]